MAESESGIQLQRMRRAEGSRLAAPERAPMAHRYNQYRFRDRTTPGIHEPSPSEHRLALKPDLLQAGRVGRAHGLDGSFVVTRPRARLLIDGARVQVAGTETEIVRRDGTDAKPLLRLAAFKTREQADSLRGRTCWCRGVDAPPLGDDEWLAEDLEGLKVIDGKVEVGVVMQL